MGLPKGDKQAQDKQAQDKPSRRIFFRLIRIRASTNRKY